MHNFRFCRFLHDGRFIHSDTVTAGLAKGSKHFTLSLMSFDCWRSLKPYVGTLIVCLKNDKILQTEKTRKINNNKALYILLKVLVFLKDFSQIHRVFSFTLLVLFYRYCEIICCWNIQATILIKTTRFRDAFVVSPN